MTAALPARAAVLERFNAPPVVAAVEPGPVGPDEILVAMRLAPINPADLLTIDGLYSHAPTLPFVLGAEGVGEVLEMGAAVRGLTVGDLVLPLSRGNWSSLRRVRAGEVVVAPGGLPLDQAAMLRINGATAWWLLHDRGLAAGDWLIQNAAGSSVAQIVRLLAGQRGVKVVDVVRDPGVAGGGAVTLADGPDLAARVQAATGDEPVRLALDCVAGRATGRLAECLTVGGELVVFGHLSSQPCEVASTLLTARQLTLRGFSLRPAEAGDPPAMIRARLEEVAALLGAAGSELPVRQVFGLTELDAALTAARGRGRGRVLLALDR